MSCTNWAQWVIKNKRSRKEEEEEEKKEGEEKGDKVWRWPCYGEHENKRKDVVIFC